MCISEPSPWLRHWEIGQLRLSEMTGKRALPQFNAGYPDFPHLFLVEFSNGISGTLSPAV